MFRPIWILALPLVASSLLYAKPVEIIRAVPQGEGREEIRQIVLTFNQKMAPLGQMARTAKDLGTLLQPEVNCQWRWTDASSLACQLSDDEHLKPANDYLLTLQAGLKSESGDKLAKPYILKFNTARPKVDYTNFYDWQHPGSPRIVVHFNQDVVPQSVIAAASFVSGKTSIAARLSPDPELNTANSLERVGLEPISPLPLGSDVQLRIGPGVTSLTGPLKGNAVEPLNFRTFSEFKFLGVRCQANDGDEDGDGPDQGKPQSVVECSPLQGVSLVFSSPVLKEEVIKNVKFTPPLSAPGKEADVWENAYSESSTSSPHKAGQTYRVHLPNHLLAQKTYTVTAATLSDVFGRKLTQPMNYQFKTTARPPAYNIPTSIAVLEQQEATDVAVYVTNLTALHLSYDALTSAGVKTGLTHDIAIPKFEDSAFAVALEARKLLNNHSGFIEGVLTATPTTENPQAYFSLQITPFQVVAKSGYMNSLAWVTDLKTGKSVSGAKVELIVMTNREVKPSPPFSTASTDAEGVAKLSANAKWPKLAGEQYYAVRVALGANLAILPLRYDFSASSGYYSPYWGEEGDGGGEGENIPVANGFRYLKAWGTTAQGVYKPGDNVAFKFYVRNEDNRRLIPAPTKTYRLRVTNPSGDEVFVKEGIVLNAFGAWSGEFKVPATAPVGWYNAYLKRSDGGHDLRVFRFLAADFTPVPFKVDTNLNATSVHIGDELKIETLATLHSGGPFAKAPLRLMGIFNPRFFTSADPVVKDFTFDSYEAYRGSDEVLKLEDESVDAKGTHHHSFKIPKMSHNYGSLMIESAVQDDRGKRTASAATVTYSGLDRRVGLKQTSWLHNKGEKADILYVVVDESGTPKRGSNVNIQIEFERVTVAKVKGAGNAYLSEYHSEWEKSATCTGTSKVEPAVCTFTPKEVGSYRAVATIQDSKGESHSVTERFYVVGAGYVTWESPDTEPLQIIPEKKEFKVGDKAKFLVKNPLPGAQALITVERYGVLKSWTMTMKDSAEVVELPIEEDYVPAFNISIALTSPRVEKSGPLGVVDLGKPTARFGSVHVEVADPFKRIEVSVKTDKAEYRPRDKVKIKIKATPTHATKAKEPIELAVVVIDEAVLSLVQGGAGAYDPYKGFYQGAGLNVDTYSLIARLVGRQKFEKKGANAGGAGGLSQDLMLRNLFKFVAYWNPNLKTDKAGAANFEFTLPDNLTGWRVLVLAVTPSDRMGLGEANFKVNKPTELRPVLPNQLTEGDKFRAGFSVFNRTAKARKIKVEVQAEGAIKAEKNKVTREFTVETPPYERKSVFVELQVDTVKEERDAKANIQFKVSARDSLDSDGLVESVPVLKRRDFESAVAYGSTTGPKVTESLQFPKDIYPDVGSVGVTLAPTVIGNVEGSFTYMQKYPYLCWEQRLTKGVMAAHYLRLKNRLPGVEWPEAKESALKMLDDAAQFQAPNGGMTFWSPLDDRVSPYLSAYTAVAFVWLREGGYKIPTEVERKLHGYLKEYLRNNVKQTFFDEGMRSTVRAIALYALVKNKSMTSADVKRYLPAMGQMSLFGQAHYLMAALASTGTEQERSTTLKAILNKSNATSGKMLFNETLTDGYRHLLTTPLRDNCAVLSALTMAEKSVNLKAMTADIPSRMVRAITQSRGKRTAFDNTQENIFCLQALIDYATAYEATAPKMNVQVALDGKSFGLAEFNKITDPAKTVERPIQASDLGKMSAISIERSGQGRLYYATRITYSPRELNASEVNSGMDIKREYYVERKGEWVALKSPVTLKRGDLIKVDLFVSLPAARSYVAISDPIPGGLEPVNRDLANASSVDADKGGFTGPQTSLYWKFKDWHEFSIDGLSFYHQELRHESARFFADYLMPGNYHLTYTAQAIAVGEFSAGPTHGEEMYDPDVFGKSKPATFVIREK